MGLHELLVDLIDQLLKLVVGQVDLEEQRAMHLEAAIVKIDATDTARTAVYREDLARFRSDGALET